MGFGYLSCRAESSISTSNSQTPSSSNSAHPESHPQKPIKIQHFLYSDLEAATNGFSEQKLLGKGSHGCVYKAVLRGRQVAVKKPSRGIANRLPSSYSSATPDIVNEVDNEIDILSNIHNPRLVNLLGFTNDSKAKDRLLVVEFMSNGTLYDVLHSNLKPPPNWGRRIRLALQTAKAMDTLHTSIPPVIHRDIKSANVLIDKNFNARLSDFGLAIRGYIDDYRVRSTPPAGTMGYLDPSYITPDNLSTKSDVFSFGILLLEIISGRKAIDVSHSPPSIVEWAIPLIRKGKLVSIFDPRIPPPKDLIVRKQMAAIAAKCVRSCRERRPSMKEVAAWLSGLSKLVPLHSWNGFNNPCLLVETMGIPVESRKAHINTNQNDTNHEMLAMRNSRRVYSDLGFRNNLMDLLAENNEEDQSGTEVSSKPPIRGSILRFGSGRFDGKSKDHSQGGSLDENRRIYWRRNKSVGNGFEIHSRGDGKIAVDI